MNLRSKIDALYHRPTLPLVIAGRKVNRQFHTSFGKYDSNPNGDKVLDREWDNLLLLDACRYDYFSEYADKLPGELASMTSLGSATREFVRANFRNRTEYDIVYVSANAWWSYLADEIDSEIHEFIALEELDCQDAIFDVELPETVADKALGAASEYPNKRLLVHFNQPHHPHIGETGLDLFGGGSGESLSAACTRVRPSKEKLERSYRETLESIIPAVRRLIDELDGKTVVTSDHGEMLKDRLSPIPTVDYGHSPGLYVDELVTVPWFECEHEDRRNIIAEQPDESDVNEKAVEERLEKLGYK